MSNLTVGVWMPDIEGTSAPKSCLRYLIDALLAQGVDVIHGGPVEISLDIPHVTASGPQALVDAGVDVIHHNKVMDKSLPVSLPVPTTLTQHGDVQWEFPKLNYGRWPLVSSAKERAVAAAKRWQYDAVCYVSRDSLARNAERFSVSNPTYLPNAPAPGIGRDMGTGWLEDLGVEPPYLFHVSGYSPRKNPSRLLEAWRLVESDAQLVIAGAGWGVHVPPDPSVTTLGYVPGDALSQLYTHAEAFIFPSLHECFGLPAVEAMRCGTLPVVGDCYSLPEVTRGEALEVDPFDTAALARAIDYALRVDVDFNRLVEASEVYSWEDTAYRFRELCSSLVAGGNVGVRGSMTGRVGGDPA